MNTCVFCDIVANNHPHHEIWWSNALYIAFLDASPSQRGHSLVIPRKHDENILDIPKDEYSQLMEAVKEASEKLRRYLKVERIAVVIEGMSIAHIHVHLIPIRAKGDLAAFPKYLLKQNELKELGDNLRQSFK